MMLKQILFILVLLVFSSCGEKSTIKNAVAPKRTANAYGDGTYTIIPFVLPLSDQAISSFDSPLQKVGFIAGGFAKLFLNVGAAMGMGKMKINLNQRIPELPVDYLKEVKIKRLFFYIEPVKGSTRKRNWFSKIFSGRNDVDFKFIDKIAVKLSSEPWKKPWQWAPDTITAKLKETDLDFLEEIFETEKTPTHYIDVGVAKELLLVRYKKSRKDTYLKHDKFGPMYVVAVEKPAKARRFLMDHPDLRTYFKDIKIVNKSLIIELQEDFVKQENFQVALEQHAETLDEYGVSFIDKCNPKTCLDLSVEDVNLVPLLSKSNGFSLDAFVEAGKVPDSFQLKGFIEFETKLNLEF